MFIVNILPQCYMSKITNECTVVQWTSSKTKVWKECHRHGQLVGSTSKSRFSVKNHEKESIAKGGTIKNSKTFQMRIQEYTDFQ